MLMRTRLLVRAFSTSCRKFAVPGDRALLDSLLRNPELDQQDARNELRWLRQSLSPGLSPPTRDSQLASLVNRRAAGEPLQYILGNTDFGPLELLCRAPTLIPRPETAFIVECLAERILAAKRKSGVKRPLRVLDLCTGSGCIPLLLSHLLGDTLHVAHGVDISPEAIELSEDNKELLACDNVYFHQSDILSPDFADRVRHDTGIEAFDLITSNPPYISARDWAQLPQSVRDHEDSRALVGGPVPGVGDGVQFYGRIAQLADQLLEPAGGDFPQIAVEIGETQAGEVSSLLPGGCETVEDQYGRDRMVLAASSRSRR